MTQFWIYATGLIILAMAFIALPLSRKRFANDVDIDELNLSVFKQQLAELDSDLQAGILDQERYDAAKRDLEKELLEDVSEKTDASSAAPAAREGGRSMALSALAVPVAAVLLYQWLGSPDIAASLAEGNTGMRPSADVAGNPHAQGGANTQQGMSAPLDQMVKQLEAKLEKEPENIDGWVMLGRSYMAMKRFPEAVQVYDRAMKINGEHVGLLLAYGEALGTNAGNNFMGRPAEMINKAFDLDPENPNTLWMSGIVAYQQSNFQTALERWEKVESRLTPQSRELKTVGDAIDDARAKLGLPPIDRPLPKIAQGGMGMGRPANMGQPGNMGRQGSAASSAKSTIQVEISLSPELSAKTKPGDLLFIYAKALSGPPMPLAAARKRVSDLPLTLQLDDSMAMMPQMKLSSFPKVLVGARVSLSGTPTAQSGDLEGEVKPVTPGQSEPVKLVINSIHP